MKTRITITVELPDTSKNDVDYYHPPIDLAIALTRLSRVGMTDVAVCHQRAADETWNFDHEAAGLLNGLDARRDAIPPCVGS